LLAIVDLTKAEAFVFSDAASNSHPVRALALKVDAGEALDIFNNALHGLRLMVL
jgi:hypothetical protein